MDKFDYGDFTAAHLATQEKLCKTSDQRATVKAAQLIVRKGCGSMKLDGKTPRGTFWTGGGWQSVLITPRGEWREAEPHD